MKGARLWTAIGAVGAFLGGVAALIAVFQRPSATKSEVASPAYFVDACEQRMKAINDRAMSKAANGNFAMDVKFSTERCKCQGRALLANYDEATVHGISDWFQAVAVGGAEMSAEEDFFSNMDLQERRRLENAFDFSIRQCTKIK